jgi:hypothetical protein
MEKDDDEAVGYCKPPRKHRWKPGQSGNPMGRPRKPPDPLSIDDAEIIRRVDAEEITVNGQVMTRREAEIRRIFALAIAKNRKARRLFERIAKSIPTSTLGGVVHATPEQCERLWK